MKTIQILSYNIKQAHIFPKNNFTGDARVRSLSRNRLTWLGDALSLISKNSQKTLSQQRVGGKVIIPRGIKFFSSDDETDIKLIFGASRGEVQVVIPRNFIASIEGQVIHFVCPTAEAYGRFRTAIGSVYRALLGVTRGYNQKLKTVGVGYKGTLGPNGLLNMALGYSHSVPYSLDSSLRVQFSRKNNRFDLKGPNVSIVNQTAQDVQSFKKPDAYKGKGVRYRGEKLLKKEGKKKK